MKILVYGINYSPELTGIGKYTGEMVEWLAAQGHEVRVITAPPYYPQWQVGENYSAWRYKREEGAATVWRCPLYVPKQPSTLKRLLHLGSFAVSSFFPLMAKLLDVTRLHQLGWYHEISLEAGLASTYQWFLENQDRFRG